MTRARQQTHPQDDDLTGTQVETPHGSARVATDFNHRKPHEPPRRVRILLLENRRVAILPLPGSQRSQRTVEQMWRVLCALRDAGTRPVFPHTLECWEANGRVIGFTREHIPINDSMLTLLYPRLTVRDLLFYGLRLSVGLHCVHRIGWAVRDLKPSNIGHRYVGSHPVPVILDWDTAAPLGQTAQEECDDGRLTIVGSPGFITPEEVRGETLVPQTDQMLLALCLMSICVGQYGHVVPGEDTHVAFLRAAQVRYPYWDIVDAVLPEPVSALLRRAMQPESAKRFPDCLAFARALRETLGSLHESQLAESARVWPLRDHDYAALASPLV